MFDFSSCVPLIFAVTYLPLQPLISYNPRSPFSVAVVVTSTECTSVYKFTHFQHYKAEKGHPAHQTLPVVIQV